MKQRTILRTSLFLLLFLLLAVGSVIVLLLYHHGVQQWAAQKAVAYVQGKTGAVLRVDSFRLDFPKHVLLKGLYAEDVHGDTLVNIGRLEVETDLYGFLRDTLFLRSIEIEDSYLRMAQQDSAWNYQFLIDAFVKPSKEQVESVFYIQAGQAPVQLKNVYFVWENTAAQQFFSAQTVDLKGRFKTLELDTLLVAFEDLHDTGSRFRYRSGPETPAVSGKFRYDQLDFRQSDWVMESVRVYADSILVDVQRMSAEESSGLKIDNLATGFYLAGDTMLFNNLKLKTGDSNLGGDLLLLLDSTGTGYSSKNLEAQVQGKVVSYFTDYPFFQKYPNDIFKINLDASGTMDAVTLQAASLDVRNGDLTAALKGKVTGFQTMPFFDLDIGSFQTSMGTLNDLLPTLVLPEQILRSDRVEASGTVRGTTNRLVLDLDARFDQTVGDDLAVSLEGILNNPSDTKKLNWDARINRLTVPSTLVERFLPPGTLPEGFYLPPMLDARGTTKGNMQRMEGILDFGLMQDNGVAPRIGTVNFVLEDFLDGDLKYVFDFSEIRLDPATVAELWRDSALMKIVRIPDSLFADVSIVQDAAGMRIEANVRINDSGKVYFQMAPDSLSGSTIVFDVEGVRPDAVLQDSFLQSMGLQGNQKISLQGTMQTDTAGSWIAEAYLRELFWNGYVFDNTTFSGRQYAPTGMFYALNLETHFTQTTDTFPLPFGNYGRFSVGVDSLLFSDSLPFLVRGDFLFDSMQLYSNRGSMEADSLMGNFTSENRVNDFEFSSTWLKVNLSGLFDPRTAPSVLSDVIKYHFKPDSNLVFPTLPAGDTLFWKLDFIHPEALSGFLVPNLDVVKPIQITGGYINGVLKTELFCEALSYSGYGGEMLHASIQLDEKEALAGLQSGNLYFMDKLAPDSLSLALRAASGTMEGDVALFDSLNATKLQLGADMEARDTLWMVKLDSTLVLQYATWTMDPRNKVVYNTTGGVGLVEHFQLERDSQLLSVEGDMVNNLSVELRAIDLGNVARILQRDSTFMSGNFNGTLRIDSLLSNQPNISAKVGIRDFTMLMRPIGDLMASVSPAGKDSFETRLRIVGANNLSVRGNFNVNGNLDMTARLDTLQLNVLEPWVNTILSDLSGIVSGRLTYKGNYRDPVLDGRIAFDNVKLRTPLNSVLYELPDDSLRITNNLISFTDIRLFDKKRHPIVVDGTVDLGSLDNILLDLSAEGKDVLLLDSKEVDSIQYYGVLYADVNGTVKGSLNSPTLTFKVKPLRGSEVNYRYDTGNTSINDNAGIVEFISYDTAQQVVDTMPVTVFPFRLNLDLELKQEESMLLRIFLNPLTRDVVEVKPFGDLHVDVFPQGDIELNGMVELTDGNASYTFQNIFRRQFKLKKGSTMDWVKSPENPNINVEAFYEVRTSPVPLLTGGGADSTYADYDKEMFWLVAKVYGYLDDLKIEFYVDYPIDSEDGTSYRNSGKEDIVRAVDNLNQNPEQQALEVFNLLVFNAFTGSSSSAGQAIDIQSNLNNLISQQLNNLTNDITWIDIDIDLYTTGASSSQTNVDVSLKKDFFDKRIRFEIEGSTAVDSDSKSAQNNNTYFDNVSLEYNVDKAGIYKITIFSNQQFNDFFQRNVTQSGAGFIFEKEYDSIKLNFKKKKINKQNTNTSSGTIQ